MTKPADWSRRGVAFVGGSCDGEELDLFPATVSINLSQMIAGKEIVELYERTPDAVRGRTVYRFTARRRDLE